MTEAQKERSALIQRWVTMFECAEKGFYYKNDKGEAFRIQQRCSIVIRSNGKYAIQTDRHVFREEDYGVTWHRDVVQLMQQTAGEGPKAARVASVNDEPEIRTGDEPLWLDGLIYVFSDEGAIQKVIAYEGYDFEKPVRLNDLKAEFMEKTGDKGDGVIYVMYDSALYGWVYETGNEQDGQWHYHGKTIGYA